jgi:uncharacterized protein
MKTESMARLLTIYINSADHYHGTPLFAAIVHLCHERGIAGATVFRAMGGYGSSGRLHTTRLLELGENLPVRIEIIDTPERIDAILPILDGMITQGLATLSDVQVRQYK